MSEAEIKDKVYDIIVSKMGVNKDQIKPESKFSDDLGADSLDTVELIMELENEFEFRFLTKTQKRSVLSSRLSITS